MKSRSVVNVIHFRVAHLLCNQVRTASHHLISITISKPISYSPALEGFGPAQTRVFDHVMRQSVEDLVLHASTWSFVAIRPDRETVLERVRELGRRAADGEGMVEMAMRTRCYRLQRL